MVHPPQTGPGTPPSAPGPRPAKILVADDSESDRAAARDALVAAGHTVVEATDGQQALEIFARDRPDLVMLDVVMPRMSGLETCRILKAKTQHTYLPVIMVSTRNSVNARVEGLRSGADDYLGKPYDAEELRARVEALLRAKRLLAEPIALRERPLPSATAPAQPGTPTVIDDEIRSGAIEIHARRRLDAEFDRAERYSDPLACLRVDFDDWDGLARAIGPRGPETLAKELRVVVDATIRKIDLVFTARPHGYLLALPNTHFPGALAVAERIARDSRRVRADHPDKSNTSVSIGVAFYPNKDTHCLQDLLELAEAALERARSEGGGKICLFQHQGYLYAPED
ncbi:MAG TPA: response regulator [Nannocystaceae bacterium]|nr:response regulator [Nannocystaceae bacterium]